jgi:DNA-binding transcriptional LysR family regulator
MNYTLHQLQVFLKIAQFKSITKAAEALHLTQPAISIQLKNFQDQFKIPLTEVIGRKLYVTDFGKEIAEAAENILNEVYAINYKTEIYKGQLSGKIRIAVVSTGKYIMPYFLSKFLKQHEGIELIMDVTNRTKVIENLEQNQIDFALVSIPPDNLAIKSLDLLQNKLYLVGSTEKKYKRQSYEMALLKTLPLIFREQGSGTRATMEKFINRHKLSFGKKMELTSNEAVKQAVLAGLGYSIMPLIGIKNELQNGSLQIIPIKGLPIKTKWQLIWLKDKKFSPASQSFLDYLKSEKNAIIETYFDWYENY